MRLKLLVLNLPLLFSVNVLEQMMPEVTVDLDFVLSERRNKAFHIILLEGGFELCSCNHPIFINVKLIKCMLEIVF